MCTALAPTPIAASPPPPARRRRIKVLAVVPPLFSSSTSRSHALARAGASACSPLAWHSLLAERGEGARVRQVDGADVGPLARARAGRWERDSGPQIERRENCPRSRPTPCRSLEEEGCERNFGFSLLPSPLALPLPCDGGPLTASSTQMHELSPPQYPRRRPPAYSDTVLRTRLRANPSHSHRQPPRPIRGCSEVPR